jgi:tRNA dimethylallyltransferase
VKKAVLILGPTASGKSRLALELAIASSLPILNVDSIQMYKGLKVGSALPTPQDMKLATHFLYAFVEKGQQITAAAYVEAVKKLIEAKDFKYSHLIFCGGSGFYLQALVKGMYPFAKADEDLNKEIDQKIAREGWEKIYQWILQKDPGLQRTVHLNDQYRIRRAFELILLSEKSPLELEKNLTPSPIANYKKIKIALFTDKEVFKTRVTERAKFMLQNGFIEEVEELFRKGFQSWPPLQSVGYKEVGQFLRGELSKEDLLPAIVLGNMKLIKKQLTWFKKNPEIKWFPLEKIAQAKDFALHFLNQA